MLKLQLNKSKVQPLVKKLSDLTAFLQLQKADLIQFHKRELSKKKVCNKEKCKDISY